MEPHRQRMVLGFGLLEFPDSMIDIVLRIAMPSVLARDCGGTSALAALPTLGGVISVESR